ncbi:MAG: heavy metal sensor histidine kinase [Verrucomicrobia bacterium]|nr:heavy metal sensor histidine kinase [Verrucomicrobiota bacterium]
MSSKPADSDPRLPAPIHFRRWSIAARLTTLYAGSTAIVLLLAAAYLYWGLAQSLDREDRALVTGKLQVLRLMLREHHDNPAMLAGEIEHEASANELLKYYLRILDLQGKVLMETEGMSTLLPVLAFPPPAPAAAPPVVVPRSLPDGRTYLMVAAETPAGDAGAERRLVHVALDVDHNAVLLADYRVKIAIALAAGVALAALSGAFVARTGLRPVRDIAHAARRISASHLDERVVPAEWPAELRELAAAFDAMLDRLEGSFNRLSEFSADLAHAMRNPIHNLRGESEVALQRARTVDEYRTVLASSLEEFDRLARMIDGLLFIARADDPRRAIERSRVPVRRELDAVREFYEALAAEHHVTVVCEGDATLDGDPMLVRRAISNLLGNALKHTPAGGRVTLTTRTLADGTVQIAVADTGSGIPAEHLPRIFDRFYQVDKTSAAPIKGAGLGLAIVHSIMRLHGGTATARSELTRGTTITLNFSVSPSPAFDQIAKYRP